jgi:predicted O-methyltransferase YrrM
MDANKHWKTVDAYVEDLFKMSDRSLESAVALSKKRGLPEIQISYPLGNLLHILALSCGARRILEIGTLGGFSTIFLARALPEDGVLYSLELDPNHASVARENLSNAGLNDVTHVLEGAASETLAMMLNENWDPFDFVFLDADKPGYTDYVTAALQLSHPGTLIVADNVVRDGEVTDVESDDPMVQGVRKFNTYIASEPSLSCTIIQTVGSKGYDGIAVAVVLK